MPKFLALSKDPSARNRAIVLPLGLADLEATNQKRHQSAAFDQGRDLLAQARGKGVVKRGQGFVEDKEIRIDGERAGERDAARWRCTASVGPDRTRGARRCLVLIYREPEKPTVPACGMMSAVLVTYRPVAPMRSSSADAMMAR